MFFRGLAATYQNTRPHNRAIAILIFTSVRSSELCAAVQN